MRNAGQVSDGDGPILVRTAPHTRLLISNCYALLLSVHCAFYIILFCRGC